MDTAEIRGVRIAYRIDGPVSAPPLLLINSLGTDHRMWEPQVAPFGRRLRVVRYDARGQGGSERPALPFTLSELGEDAIGLLDHLGIRRAHVCGVSLGGLVALWLAVHRPERLTTMTAANTAARIGTTDGWTERIQAVRAGGLHAVRDVVLDRFFSQRFRVDHPEQVAAMAQVLQGTDPDGYVGACMALRDADLRDEVGRIAVPALFIGGTADLSTPPQQTRWLADEVVGSTYLELEGAGHLSNIERPDAFNDAVLAHALEPRP